MTASSMSLLISDTWEHTSLPGKLQTVTPWTKDGEKANQLRKLRFCPAKAEAKAKVILSKIYAGAPYGVEAAGASPANG